MMDSLLKFLFECLGVSGLDSRDEDAITLLENFAGDFDHLNRGFARAKNNLRKTLSQGAMLIHLRKAKIGNGLLSQCSEDLFLADFSSAKLLEQLIGLVGGHAREYGRLSDFLQQKR